MKKIDISSDLFSIYGLPWYEENKNRLWRLPMSIKDEVSQAVWNLSLSPSGARIRFKSDTSLLGLDAFYDLGNHMNNMCRIGQAGCDVYVDGEFWACIFPTNTGPFEEFFFENVDRKMRNYEIYLPPYHPIDLRRIIVDDDATIEPPDLYKFKKPLVFYGTSITQGGCSSRAGLTYQAQLSRALNLDFVNLGFSGNGRGDLPIAKLMSEIDASCYILDYGQNNISISEMQKVYLSFIDKIREEKPKTPILLTTPLFSTLEKWDEDFSTVQNGRRKIVKEAYNTLMKKGIKNIFILEWDKSIDMEDGEGYVDGLHPNDLGFYRMSQGMKVILKDILDI